MELKYLHLVNYLQDHMEIPEGAFVDKLLMKKEKENLRRMTEAVVEKQKGDDSSSSDEVLS